MLSELIKKKAEIEARIAEIMDGANLEMAPLRDEAQAVMIDIEHVIAEKLADLRKLQAKEYGVVNLVLDGIKVTETVPKKVEWDQQKLNDLFDAIGTAGDDPRTYMKMELKVAEKQYAAFVPEVKAMFADARTVTPGKPQVVFEEAANA